MIHGGEPLRAPNDYRCQTFSKGLNSFGDSRVFRLPNAGLDVAYSTKYFKMSTGGSQLLEPDPTSPCRSLRRTIPRAAMRYWKPCCTGR
jgi:hypothetical protein